MKINRVRIATKLLIWKAAYTIMDGRCATAKMMREAVHIIEDYDPVLKHTQKLVLKLSNKIQKR
jgi:hypothetical protein